MRVRTLPMLACTLPLLAGCLIQLGSSTGRSDRVLAVAAETFCGRWVPGTAQGNDRSSLGNVCDQAPRVVAHGGDLQQMVAQAFLERMRWRGSFDASLVNGGGVRTDLPGLDLFPGDVLRAAVTVDEALAILPFRNTMVQLTLTGAQLKTALEDGLDYLLRTPGSRGPYPYLSGIRFDVDVSRARGSRLANLQRRSLDGTWLPLLPTDNLRLATTSYLAGGGDGYDALRAISGTNRTDFAMDEATLLLEWLDRGGAQIARLPVDEYSTRSFAP